MTIKVAVVGASGRMGKLAIDLIDSAQDLTLHASLNSRSSLSELDGADVVFDVTKLEVSEQVVDYCVARAIPVVVGTSGWSAAKLSELGAQVEKHSATAVIVPNFSIGSMLATRLQPKLPSTSRPLKSSRLTTNTKSTHPQARQFALQS